MTPPGFHVLTIAADDGVRLAATRVGRRDAAATVVYLHPLLRERGFWFPVARRMDEQLCGAVAQLTYDQRGHGDSGIPDRREITTLRRLADDLDAVLARACGSVVLVAHSTAAQLVYAYATAHPDHAATLAGLVFLNATAEPLSLPRYLQIWPPRLIRLRAHRALDPVTAAGEALLGYRLRRNGGPLPASAGADARVAIDILGTHPRYGLPVAIAERLRHIPSVVLAGERDRFIPPQQAVGLANALWADYDIVTGAGHHLPHTHLDRATNAVTATLDHALRVHLEHANPATTPTPGTEPGRT
ncbi:alpha/beta fold hydrolase [Nocardia wallacei]|uniref:alpha/beta fold hydrolase n=1 Tax=Nocardia wallacei TaxID=480035 RepID=UPI002454365F|nr:alpha/beta hydrolase [Nocardia wallacei]